jgi:hypothetical protein
MGGNMDQPTGTPVGLAVRVFLSHASSDKPFVDIVANRLGRQRVQYDKWVFETGASFIAAVRIPCSIGRFRAFRQQSRTPVTLGSLRSRRSGGVAPK